MENDNAALRTRAERLERALKALFDAACAVACADAVLLVTESKISHETGEEIETRVTQDYINELWNALVDQVEQAQDAPKESAQ